MPFVSKAQVRWGNSPAGRKALGASGVQEWNAATKGKSLPERKSVYSAAAQRHGKAA